MLCAGQTGRWISRARCAEGKLDKMGKGGMKMDHRDALKIAIERLEKRCAECEENDELLTEAGFLPVQGAGDAGEAGGGQWPNGDRAARRPRRGGGAMKLEMDDSPTRRQRAFHESREDEVLYGGAAGGGKSCAVVMDAFFRCARHPGTVAYLFRRTYRELEDTLIAEAIRRIPAQVYRYSASAHEMRLVNGSCLRFRHCQNEADRFQYQGAEIHWLYIDELTHFTKAIYDFLRSRVRAEASLGIRPVVRCTSNPGGVGHAWVKARVHRPGAAQQNSPRTHRGAGGSWHADAAVYSGARTGQSTPFSTISTGIGLQACGAAGRAALWALGCVRRAGVHRMA